jgi:hypothetical protein
MQTATQAENNVALHQVPGLGEKLLARVEKKFPGLLARSCQRIRFEKRIELSNESGSDLHFFECDDAGNIASVCVELLAS